MLTYRLYFLFFQLTATKMFTKVALSLRHLFALALLIFIVAPAKIPLAANAGRSVAREASLRGQAVIDTVPVAGKRCWFDCIELIHLSDLEVISKWFIAIKYSWNLFCAEFTVSWWEKVMDKLWESVICVWVEKKCVRNCWNISQITV